MIESDRQRHRRRIRFACGLMICLLSPVPPDGGAAESDEARINQWLMEAARAQSPPAARKKIEKARQVLQTNRKALGTVLSSLLQAQISQTQGQAELNAWRQRAGNNPDLPERFRAQRLLLTCLDEYQDAQHQARRQIDRFEERADDDAYEKNPKWRRAMETISRANYAIAWIRYRLAQIQTSGGENRELLLKALKGFESFTANGYRDHAIVADCFLGQAFCLSELDRQRDCLKLLSPARADNTPRDVFKRMTLLRIRNYRALVAHAELDESARAYFDSLGKNHRFDRVELEMLMDWVGALAALAGEQTGANYKRYRNRLRVVAQKIYPYGHPWQGQLADVLGEFQDDSALGCLMRARHHFTASRFDQALREARRGRQFLDAPAGESSAGVPADLAYLQAVASWNLQRYRGCYRASAGFIRRYPQDRRCHEVLPLAVQAGLQALKAKPALGRQDFTDLLAFAEEHFSDTAASGLIPWYRATFLIEDRQFDPARKLLEAFLADSDQYAYALYGFALLAYQEAQESSRTSEEVADLLHASARRQRQFFAATGTASGEAPHPLRKTAIEMALGTARQFLDLYDPDVKGALGVLDVAEGSGRLERDLDNRAKALRLEVQLETGQVDLGLATIAAARTEVIRNTHLATALFNQLDAVEARYEDLAAAGADQAAALAGDLLKVYGVLLDHLKLTTHSPLQGQRQAIRRRLALSQVRSGRYEQAINNLKRWQQTGGEVEFVEVVRGLATAYEKTGRYDEAIEQWRRLVRGLEKDSPGWYEANFHLIQCHSNAGRKEQAQKLLAYLRVRSPVISSADWAQRFDQLQNRLSGEVDGATQQDGGVAP